MEVKIYKCFIGSPGDTTEERKYCKDVFNHINKTIGEKFNFRVESLMWEDDSRPAFGDYSQAVINRQLLLKEYNLFIGIMWARFGSPTKTAESGTIEEFEDAYHKYKEENQDLEICMYFNKKDIPQDKMEPDQIGKVFEFKKRVSELGGLYNEYLGAEQFKENLLAHLTKYFLEKYDVNSEKKEHVCKIEATNEIIEATLKEKFDDSLSMFKGQNTHWINPVLCKSNLISTNYVENYESKVDLENLIEEPQSIIIKSPPQFGLTSLSRYFVYNAWLKKKIWLYLDATNLDRNSIEKSVKKELKNNFFTDDISCIECIVLDTWKATMHGGMKLLKNLSVLFKNIPIIVMETIDADNFLEQPETEDIQREFNVVHLLTLPKTEIRKMVSSYNDITYIADEDKVLNKIVKDLDTLNIHRTPMNCLTLLKVSEKYFNENTVNRSDMLGKVLFILFDLSDIPTYQTKPDLKDCEFVLGNFCEKMLRTENYYFSKVDFIASSQIVCKENYIELDINTLFEVLFVNGIIIDKGNEFTFRATYWMFYFAAHRMHADPKFCAYIFESDKYANYPEIIEFYTGIDRRRTDALEILQKDILSTCSDVLNKLGLPEHIDPYVKVEWNPSSESVERVRNEIGENIQASKLPTQIKDQHSDAGQNQLRPYDQGIRTIMHEYSLALLMRKITASSRALRNSDYANPAIKKALLESIVVSYEQVAKALMILTPELAINGEAAFGGQGFNLDGDFGETVDLRMNRILQEIPGNVVNYFKDDIDSDKLGPLLLDKIATEKVHLTKHILILLIARIRPTNWRITLEKYINSLPKNSFYLYSLMGQIRFLYFYDYSTDTEINELKHLIQLGYAKHEFGNSNPSKKTLSLFTQSILKKPKIEEEVD